VRLVSRTSFRLLLFNLLLVFLPVAGFLYLDVFERQLLRSQERGMVQQARVLAAALSAAPAADAESARRLIASLEGRLDARLRVVDVEGNVLADSSVLAPPPEPAPRRDEYSPGGPEPRPARDSLLYRAGAFVYRIAARVLHAPSPSFESAEFYGSAQKLDGPEIRAALDGRYGSKTRVSPAGQRSVTLYSAVPFRREGRVAGAVLVSESTYRILQDLYVERLNLSKVVVVSIAAAALLSWLVAGTIAGPLRRLRNEASILLDRRGRLKGPFRGSRRADEIGDLARALEVLTRRLDGRIRALESFAAELSHELRNPLASIRGAAELAAEVDDPAERRRFREIVQRDIARVERLLAEVRDIAAIDARLAQEEKEDVPLERLLAEMVESVNVRERGRVTCRLEASGDGAAVRGSADRVSQLLGNLLDNAASFSPSGGEVAVSLRRSGPSVVVEIADRGPGILPQHLERVFERFFTYRPGAESAGKDGHSGLGLAIAAAIAEGYGGEITARNRESGGAVFEVRLPAAAPAR
jgi:two-component system sensor histidine kinase ChvG